MHQPPSFKLHSVSCFVSHSRRRSLRCDFRHATRPSTKYAYSICLFAPQAAFSNRRWSDAAPTTPNSSAEGQDSVRSLVVAEVSGIALSCLGQERSPLSVVCAQRDLQAITPPYTRSPNPPSFLDWTIYAVTVETSGRYRCFINSGRRPAQIFGRRGELSLMSASVKGLTVLVVEDDWLLRQQIVSELQDAEWTVLEAATGRAALAVLQAREKVDLLVTDIQLADAITGWSVAEAFRASNANLPVIYASGHPSNDSRRVPGSTFLSKPVETSRLLHACGDLRASRRPRGA
jgi:two-component system, OmpR family, response regulator